MKELILQLKHKTWNTRTICDLNDYMRLQSTHWAKANKYKQDCIKVFGTEMRKQNIERLKFCCPCRINFIFMESAKEKVRDADNIFSTGNKILLDTMQRVGILDNDNQHIVKEIRNKVFLTNYEPKIIVRIKELTEEEIAKNEEEKRRFENYGKCE